MASGSSRIFTCSVLMATQLSVVTAGTLAGPDGMAQHVSRSRRQLVEAVASTFSPSSPGRYIPTYRGPQLQVALELAADGRVSSRGRTFAAWRGAEAEAQGFRVRLSSVLGSWRTVRRAKCA